MKIRNGFVSNSSSSSFIIGLAKVPEGTINSKKIILTEDGKLNHDILMTSYYDLNVKKVPGGRYQLSTEAFDETSVVIFIEDGDSILFLNGTGVEPTYEDGEYNYDAVELTDEWFSSNQLVLADQIIKAGGKVQYGVVIMDEAISGEYTIEEVKVEVTKYNVKYKNEVIETFDNKYKAESSINEKIVRDKRINFLQSKLFETLQEAYSINNETYIDKINDIIFTIHNLSIHDLSSNSKSYYTMTAVYRSTKDNKTYKFDENFWIDDKCWDTFTDLMFERYGFAPSLPYYYWPK